MRSATARIRTATGGSTSRRPTPAAPAGWTPSVRARWAGRCASMARWCAGRTSRSLRRRPATASTTTVTAESTRATMRGTIGCRTPRWSRSAVRSSRPRSCRRRRCWVGQRPVRATGTRSRWVAAPSTGVWTGGVSRPATTRERRRSRAAPTNVPTRCAVRRAWRRRRRPGGRVTPRAKGHCRGRPPTGAPTPIRVPPSNRPARS